MKSAFAKAGIFCIAVLVFFNTSAQILPKPFRNVFTPIPPRVSDRLTNCTLPGRDGCNFINNNNVNPAPFPTYDPNNSGHLADPFNFNGGPSLIPFWDIATGSPTIYDAVFFGGYPAPPTGITGYYFGATSFFPPLGGNLSESVVQKIPALTPNTSYSLSFYKMFKSWAELPPPYNTNFPEDNFKIVLMKCQDYNQTFLSSGNITYQVPPLPANSQTIYCETAVSNGSWDRVSIKFTAQQDFDMIWIYPETNAGNTNPSGLLVTAPELYPFTAGPTPGPTSPPNCTVTIGPAIPNCGPTGAVFTWTSPNSTAYPVTATNQQIQVDNSIPANVGVWTLTMTLPGAVTTNNTCTPGPVSATVTVSACQSCTPPTISANGLLDQCVFYEAGFLTFTTNLTSNIQWYNNGNAIPGATGQSYLELNNPGPGWPTTTGTYYVKNTLTGCISDILTTTRRNYTTPYPNYQSLSLYCKNVVSTIGQQQSFSDPNTIYRWKILDPFGNDVTGTSVILGINNSTTSFTTISFANYPYTSATIILNTTDNGCTNDFWSPYTVSIYPDPCPLKINTESKISVLPNSQNYLKTSIFPNPAINQVTITSTEPINSIEISDLMNPTLKRIKTNNTKSVTINIADLKPGVYNCKITTAKGIAYQKLLINRN